MDTSFWVWVVLVTFFSAWYAAVIIHELGHAVAGRIVGYRVHAIGTGMGRPLVTVRVFGVALFVGRTTPTGGLALLTYPASVCPVWREVVMLAAGAATNTACGSILAGITWGLYGTNPTTIAAVIAVSAGCNLLAGIAAVVPVWHTAGKAKFLSDGGRIVLCVTDRIRVRCADAITTLHALDDLAGGIQCEELQRYVRLNAALLWVSVGATDAARKLLARIEEVEVLLRPEETCLWHTARAALLAADNRRAEAIELLNRVGERYRAVGDLHGWGMSHLYAAEVRARVGDNLAVDAAVKTLTAGGVTGRRRVRQSLRLAEHMARLYRGDPSAAEELVGLMEQQPKADRDPGQMVYAFQMAAAHFRRVDDGPGEKRFLLLALRQADRFAQRLLFPDDQAVAAVVREAMVARIREMASEAGCEPDGLTDGPIVVVESSCTDPASERLRFRLGLGLWVLGVVVGVICWYAALSYRDVPFDQRWSGVCLALYAVFAGLLLAVTIIYATISQFVRWWRPKADLRFGSRLCYATLTSIVLPAILMIPVLFLKP